jgi:hypothetical protein
MCLSPSLSLSPTLPLSHSLSLPFFHSIAEIVCHRDWIKKYLWDTSHKLYYVNTNSTVVLVVNYIYVYNCVLWTWAVRAIFISMLQIMWCYVCMHVYMSRECKCSCMHVCIHACVYVITHTLMHMRVSEWCVCVMRTERQLLVVTSIWSRCVLFLFLSFVSVEQCEHLHTHSHTHS